MLLFIDSSIYNGLRLALVPPQTRAKTSSTKVAELQRELAYNENYKTLETIEKFLKANKVKTQQLQKIVVCTGPGSFTGIRVGIAIAQAMGFALTIPVAVVPQPKIPQNLTKLWTARPSKKLTLNYGQKPNITISKKKK